MGLEAPRGAIVTAGLACFGLSLPGIAGIAGHLRGLNLVLPRAAWLALLVVARRQLELPRRAWCA
jgi:hypothetical protein